MASQLIHMQKSGLWFRPALPPKLGCGDRNPWAVVVFFLEGQSLEARRRSPSPPAVFLESTRSLSLGAEKLLFCSPGLFLIFKKRYYLAYLPVFVPNNFGLFTKIRIIPKGQKMCHPQTYSKECARGSRTSSKEQLKKKKEERSFIWMMGNII